MQCISGRRWIANRFRQNDFDFRRRRVSAISRTRREISRDDRVPLEIPKRMRKITVGHVSDVSASFDLREIVDDDTVEPGFFRSAKIFEIVILPIGQIGFSRRHAMETHRAGFTSGE